MMQEIPDERYLEFGVFGASGENIFLSFEDFFLTSDVQNRIVYLHGLKFLIDEYIEACEHEKALSQ